MSSKRSRPRSLVTVQLAPSKTETKEGGTICEYTIGTAKYHNSKLNPSRVLVVVGGTGAGKSTFVNAMVNYLLDVKWEDDIRYKIVAEQLKGDQAESQTQSITAYKLNPSSKLHLNYPLTIIDTPGFADTHGKIMDQVYNQRMVMFLASNIDCLGQIHGIAFVIQSCLSRLTKEMEYVLNSITPFLSKFNTKSLGDNIFIMSTFCDIDDPNVLHALKAANFRYKELFPFNNKALFNKDGEKMHDYWDVSYQSFSTFFRIFESTTQ